MQGGSNSSFSRTVFVITFMCGWYCCTGENGTASFYPNFLPTACYGNDSSQIPEGSLVAAASNVIWDNGGACGRNYSVRCTGTMTGGIQGSTPIPIYCKNVTVVIKIVDHCGDGCRGTAMDLSQEAFQTITVPAAGEVYIDYEQV